MIRRSDKIAILAVPLLYDGPHSERLADAVPVRSRADRMEPDGMISVIKKGGSSAAADPSQVNDTALNDRERIGIGR